MKYIYNYIEHSLNESFNSKEAKKKFLDKGLISKKDFTIIKKAFLPKYVYWGCRERAKEENVNTILDSIYDVTVWFEKSKQYLKSKDLYSYAYEELRLLMNDPSIGPKKKKTKGQGKYNIIYEDDKGNIAVHVQDHTASVYWAHKYREGEIADGQWCTAAYSDDSNFINYSEQGPIIIYILPNEKLQRICRASDAFVEFDIYSIEDIKTKRINKADEIYLDEIEIVYFNHTDTQLEEFPKLSIPILKSVDKYIEKNISSIDKEKLFKFNINNIKHIHLYYLTRLMNIEGLDNIQGPYKEDIINYCNENILKLNSINIKKLDASYKFFNYINVSGDIEIYASKEDLSDIRYAFRYREHSQWEIPRIKNVKQFKRISREETDEYFNISENPLDSFSKSYIKKYNIRSDISRDESYHNNARIDFKITFDINGICKDLQYVTFSWDTNLNMAKIIKLIDHAVHTIIDRIEKFKDDISTLINLGYELIHKELQVYDNSFGFILIHKSAEKDSLHFTTEKNQKSFNIQYNGKPYNNISDFLKAYKNN